ncbi:MAG TPA: thioredoxin domain-containing protein [Kofleriaceae bacterium]|nr:thioredoxin domain-containing protein [Kofleriaceae bacterium]
MRRWTGAALAAIGLLAAPGAALAQEIGFDTAATYHVPVGDGPSRGPADALVTIVEFSDFQCRFCRIASDTVAELVRLYPREVRVVYRHMLLDPDEGTLPAEAAAAAAAQGRFWAFHDRVFAEDGRIDRAALEHSARQVGLDMPRFRRDLDDGRFRSAVREEHRQAAELGVAGTPAFFVNGRPMLGAQGLGSFIALVEEERAQAAALVKGGVPRAHVYKRVIAPGRRSAGPIASGAGDIPERQLDESVVHPVGPGHPAQRLGSDDALVTIVEFGDYRCGYCAVVLPVLIELKQQYGADLRLVYRHLPLGGNAVSRRLAEAAEAAAEQGRFWEMHVRLFASDGPLDRTDLEAMAAELGLDMARFRAALDRRRNAPAVSRDAADAARLGVRATPTFFINGTPISGAASAQAFRAVIDLKMLEALRLVKSGVPRSEIYGRVTQARPARKP